MNATRLIAELRKKEQVRQCELPNKSLLGRSSLDTTENSAKKAWGGKGSKELFMWCKYFPEKVGPWATNSFHGRPSGR